MKPKLTFKIILILASALFIVQCEERCPEFNTDILNWAPYKVNDTISFSNEGSFKNLIVFENLINHGESEKFHIGCQKCSACDQDEYFVKIVFDSLNIEIRYTSSNHPENSTIYLENLDHSLNTATYSDSTISNYSFNGSSYEHIMIYDFSSTHNSDIGIKKIIMAKSFGIIAIINKQGIWNLNSMQSRNIKISDSRLNNIEGC